MAKEKESAWKKLSDKDYMNDVNIEKVNISDLNTENMKIYGANINLARVFPDIHDGLKLVERRILYTMYANTKAIKKAFKVNKIYGDTMTIHPHGDSSILGTIVRLAQPWSMLIPYIDGEGNFGSIQGDEAAAGRYLEARLSEYAVDCFFSDWDPSLVLMEETYNKDSMEPAYLPTKYPNCLLSASDGLGFGSANHIPTFNFEEIMQSTIKLIKDPDFEPVLIPDITTGCLIIDEGKFPEICSTGRGTFKMRAEVVKDEDRKVIIVKSIPFQVSLLAVKEKIRDLVEDKTIPGFKDIKDYSGNNKIHLELYFRPEVDLSNIISILYTKTDLQKTYPVQIKMVDNLAIEDFSVKSALLRWIDIRIQFKRKMYIRKLINIEQKLHILNILIRILTGKNAEKTIRIIRGTSKETIITSLMKEYDISSLQAKEIANMRLSAFTKTAYEEYQKEVVELPKKLKEYKKFVTNPEKIKDEILKELEEGIKKYSAPRRSRVIKLGKESKYSDFDAQLIFTKNGYVKKLNTKAKNIGSLGETDEPVTIKKINNQDEIVIFDKRGCIHTLEVGSIKQDDSYTIGTPLSTYININGKPVSTLNRKDINENTSFIFITKNGIIKKTTSDNFAFKNSIIAITLKPDDELVSVIPITKDKDIIAYSKYGNGLRFNTSEIPFSKRMAMGVIAFNLASDDNIIGVDEVSKNDKYLCIITEKGYVKKCTLDVLSSKKRRSEPVSIISLYGKDSVQSMLNCTDGDVIKVITKKDSYDIHVNELPVQLKYQAGDKIIPVKKTDMIIQSVLIKSK